MSPSVLAAVTASLLVAATLGGCTSGSSPASSGTDPRTLGPSALPGWRSAPGGPGLWAEVEVGPTVRCLGVAGSHPVSEQPSAVYSGPDALVARQVRSEIVKFPSPTVAERVGSALGGQAGAECLQGGIERSLRRSAESVGIRLTSEVQVTSIRLAPRASADPFGYREAISARPAAGDQHLLAVYVDLAGFVEGRYLAQLETVSVGQLFPAGIERRLITDMTSRPSPSTS